jgi:hypothetical protein
MIVEEACDLAESFHRLGRERRQELGVALRLEDLQGSLHARLPLLFTVWSLWDLVRIYGVTTQSVLVWLVGILIGIAAGWLLVRSMTITVDPASGVIHHPADYTLLPPILVTFAVKYAFGAISATSPELLQQPAFLLADLGLSGLFSGIFVGKFAVYAGRYFSARKVPA